MPLGFKKNFFGYNCEEVTEYITKMNAQNQQSINSLKEKIKAESENTAKANEKIAELEAQVKELGESLDFYKSKYDEVKKLSDNIGKLYLVAQTNAKAIVDSANTATDATKAELAKNIELLDSTEKSLDSFEEKINELTRAFSLSVAELKADLENIRNLSDVAEKTSQEQNDSFQQIYNSLA